MNQDDDLKSQVVKSLAWLAGMQYIGQIISWGITILLIRILTPGDYGLMAMSSVCIGFLFLIGELGLGAAIIQKKEIKKEQLSNIFGFIIISHGLLAGILFFGSPLIALYFSEPRLVLILKVLSMNFLFLAMYIIPQSLLVRQMDFKRKSILSLIATILSVSLSLILALMGYGVWSLIWGAVLIHAIFVIGYNLLVPIFLVPRFNYKEIRDFISFGAYTLGSRVLWYFYSRADIFIGGRILGNQLIGVYSVALELSQIPMDKLMPIINQVAFPAYSRIQSDLDLVRSNFLKATRIAGVFIFPIFWGLLIIAPEFVEWVLGNRWIEVIWPLQIMCLIMPFRALGTLVSPMLIGIGRVDINFLYVIIASVVMPVLFLIGVKYGVVGLALAWVIGYAIVFFITLKLSLPLLNLSISDFLSNILIGPFASAVMISIVFICKYLMSFFFPLSIITCISVVIGMVTYCVFVFLVKKAIVYEAWDLFPAKEKVRIFFKKFPIRKQTLS